MSKLTGHDWLTAFRLSGADPSVMHTWLAYASLFTRFTTTDEELLAPAVDMAVRKIEKWISVQHAGSKEKEIVDKAIARAKSDQIDASRMWKKISQVESKLREQASGPFHGETMLDADLKQLRFVLPCTDVEQITYSILTVFQRNAERYSIARILQLLKTADSESREELADVVEQALSFYPAVRTTRHLVNDIWQRYRTPSEIDPIEITVEEQGSAFHPDLVAIVASLIKGPSRFQVHDFTSLFNDFDTAAARQMDLMVVVGDRAAETRVDTLSRLTTRMAHSALTVNQRKAYDPQTNASYIEVFDTPVLAIEESTLKALANRTTDRLWPDVRLLGKRLQNSERDRRAFVAALRIRYSAPNWLLGLLFTVLRPLCAPSLTWAAYVTHRTRVHQVATLISIYLGMSTELPTAAWFTRNNATSVRRNLELVDTGSVPEFDTVLDILEWFDEHPASPLPFNVHVVRSVTPLQQDPAILSTTGIYRHFTTEELQYSLDDPVPEDQLRIWKEVTDRVRDCCAATTADVMGSITKEVLDEQSELYAQIEKEGTDMRTVKHSILMYMQHQLRSKV